MSDYRVRFSATSIVPLADDAASRLETALVTMPGIDEVAGVGPSPDGPGVQATFWIDVRLGMADAARDGSRLAKEALKVAGMGEAQLVELSVTMMDRPDGATGTGS
ncbi:MAG: hypothetical protein JHC74_10495 [Thermoleophilia bacterium]|nr:hypothetical protein [Thermoleophilia bacterium]